MLHQNRLAQMGELIAMIAHQWHQPLNNLSLLNQLLVFKYRQKRLDDAAMAQFQEESRRLVHFMSETIDDFRDFFKPQTEKSLFSMNALIGSLCTMVEQLYEKEGISPTSVPMYSTGQRGTKTPSPRRF